MQFLEQEIFEIAEATWQSIVGMQVSSGAGVATMPSPEGFLTGSVEISGAWNGVVLMHGAEPLIRNAAAVIFGSNASEVSHQDQLDAMYELTNIIGGNIKSLLQSHVNSRCRRWNRPHRNCWKWPVQSG